MTVDKKKEKDEKKVFYKDKRYQGITVIILGIAIKMFGGDIDSVFLTEFVGSSAEVIGIVYTWGAHWYERIMKQF